MSWKLKLTASYLFFVYVREAFVKLCKCLEKNLANHSDKPMVVIAIDGAQKLATQQGV